MTKVKFICGKYKNLDMVYKSDQHGYTMDDEGRQIVVRTVPEYIHFRDHVFETDDQAKIEFIRKCPMFTGKGDIKRIDEALPPDPNQQRLIALIQQHGYAGLVAAAERQYGPPPGAQVADPIAQTAQYVAQQAAQTQAAVQQQQRQVSYTPEQIAAMQTGQVVPFNQQQVPPQTNVVQQARG